MRYIGDIYRPPGEWKSYLLQCTVGCSHNACTFCGNYQKKRYYVRPMQDILEDIEMAKYHYSHIRGFRMGVPLVNRVFLCDGDAIAMDTEDLLLILSKLYEAFPLLERVSTYAGPRSTLNKTPEELKALYDAGLTRAYLGVETGWDDLLYRVNKGVRAGEMLEAGTRLRESGMDLWDMVIIGLAGEQDSYTHISETVKMINAMKPRHLSALVFVPAEGTPMYEDVKAGRFTCITPEQALREIKWLVEGLEVDPLHFTANHASNYLPIKGGLPEDRERFLKLIQGALDGDIAIRTERPEIM